MTFRFPLIYLTFLQDSTTGTTVAGQSGVAGSSPNQLNTPTGFTFDQFDNMYIMDSGNNRIQKWPPGSTYGTTMVSAAMYNPRGIAFNPAGDLVVADYSYDRVILFRVTCRK